ncbi:alpha/beta hydrolase family protein [Actinomadura algeriensis]|uniref:Poly(ethylene terephthalate) hydrolase n=1 Tax=Actinomadura algeriensis TaxID=1679523 RepID=A0ABR9JQE6_9ACTN|nr:alpha/beta hydrolase [Actinomadura algeriensis]MBE1532792.1 putative dienelactone hydrolase [Actinomadura algeriensis]
MNKRPMRALSALPAAILAAGAVLAPAASAAAAPRAVPQAAANPYERGPAPTEESITADEGAFEFETIDVPAGSGEGFNQGTIYAPTDTSQGTFGAIAVSPGFVSPEAWISWYGPSLASRGFVVMTIETNTMLDFPGARGDQLLAALDYLTGDDSPVGDRIDPSRLAVMGHSMGGGGTLEAASKRTDLQAAVPLAPWNLNSDWSGVRTPTMILGAQNDFIAANGVHSEPFYEGLTAAPEKAYAEIENTGHMSFNTPNDTIAKYTIAWMKRYVDDDTRYEQFLCPAPADDPALVEYRDTCPGS